jgi:hypothetical protein
VSEIRRLDPKTLKPRDVNARFMSPGEYQRLVENVRTDGALTSAVLACLDGDEIEILSGHHRTMAAIEAGLPLIDAIVITTPLSEERKVAIQLAHNAVTGKDNPSVLAELYKSIGLDAKMFSGLTDDVLDFDKLTISGFQAGVKYEELRFAFLPEDRHSFELVVKRIKGGKVAATHLARYAEFDAFFDAIIRTKAVKGVENSAMALAIMAELANERLDQIEADKDSA